MASLSSIPAVNCMSCGNIEDYYDLILSGQIGSVEEAESVFFAETHDELCRQYNGPHIDRFLRREKNKCLVVEGVDAHADIANCTREAAFECYRIPKERWEEISLKGWDFCCGELRSPFIGDVISSCLAAIRENLSSGEACLASGDETGFAQYMNQALPRSVQLQSARILEERFIRDTFTSRTVSMVETMRKTQGVFIAGAAHFVPFSSDPAKSLVLFYEEFNKQKAVVLIPKLLHKILKKDALEQDERIAACLEGRTLLVQPLDLVLHSYARYHREMITDLMTIGANVDRLTQQLVSEGNILTVRDRLMLHLKYDPADRGFFLYDITLRRAQTAEDPEAFLEEAAYRCHMLLACGVFPPNEGPLELVKYLQERKGFLWYEDLENLIRHLEVLLNSEVRVQPVSSNKPSEAGSGSGGGSAASPSATGSGSGAGKGSAASASPVATGSRSEEGGKASSAIAGKAKAKVAGWAKFYERAFRRRTSGNDGLTSSGLPHGLLRGVILPPP